MNYKLGWKREAPDARDLIKVFPETRAPLPKKVDLRRFFGPVYDQGSLGSCTANAICGAFTYSRKGKKQPEVDPSRLFLYYNERVMEGTVNEDAGAFIRDGMKSLNREGISKEISCPYIIEKFAEKPTSQAYAEALENKIAKYQRVVQTQREIKMALANNHPVVFGFEVYENFWKFDPAKEIMPMPKGEMQGGHAVLIVGYDNSKRVFIIRNSWGNGWGDKGYFLMPYEFVVSNKFCSDFWIIA